MNATKEGHKELLLRSGATIDLQEKFGRSASIIPIEQNRNEMASCNLVQNDGSSASMSASANGNVKIIC